METLLQDIRYGLRMLLKKPLVAAVAVIAFALGIGANTAMFSMVDALVLRPLNFKDLDRLVMVWNSLPQGGNRFQVSPADFADYKAQNTVFDSLVAHSWWDVNITGNGEPDRVQAFQVTSNFFDTLGVKAAMGRTFYTEEDQVGHESVAILSHALWQRRFGGDTSIINKTVTLDGRDFTVVGVMPQDFDWPMSVELWTPLVLTVEQAKDRRNHYLHVMGRIKPELGIKEAQAEMNIIARRLADQYPDDNADRGVALVHLPGQYSDDFVRPILAVLMGAVGFVLLIACANVANLQLARATGRQKEIAVRIALGASRWRIIRQLLTESIMLSLLGSIFGLLLAMWGADFLKNSFPADQAKYIPGLKHMGIDDRALIFTLAIVIITGIISGLAPALQTSKPDLNETLKEGGRTSAAGAPRRRLRSLLVVSEVALALVLLVGTGLMVQGFARLVSNQKQGFDPDHLLTMRVTLPVSKYSEPQQRTLFYKQVIERIKAMPEVESAAAISFLPSSGDWNTEQFAVEDRPTVVSSELPFADFQMASPGYFETMRIPLAGGRDFNDGDDRASAPVAIISEAVARRFWPDASPIGKRIRVEDPSHNHWKTIVGVVGDVKTFMFDKQPRLTIYIPHAQSERVRMQLAVRAAGDPLAIAGEVRARVLAVDKDQPVYNVESMERVISNHVSGIRMSAALMAVFGALALTLAAVGVYSVMAYSVTQRTHEIGVRMALGASSGDVLRLVVGHAMKMAMAGLAIGLPAAYGLTKVMAGAFAGVIALDPVMFAGFALLLVAVALASGYFPARRASKVDPMIALRSE